MTIEDKAKKYLLDKGFKGFANNTTVPTFMVEFARQMCEEQIHHCADTVFDFMKSQDEGSYAIGCNEQCMNTPNVCNP